MKEFENLKKLGFGMMRFPQIASPDGEGKIDMDELRLMVDEFIARGYKYFDTAYVYGDGNSEEVIGELLSSRYPRDAFYLATKMPSKVVNTPEDMEAAFQLQLSRTKAGYFDFYLLHAIGRGNIEAFDKAGAWAFLQQKKRDGLIKHVGFSFHDSAEMLDEVLTAHPEAEFVQLQINYADWEDPKVQSGACYEVARKHNKPIIIMEPVKGGNLAGMGDEIRKVFTDAAPDQTIASWAVRFAASLDGVMVMLSGMSDLEQVKDNLATFDDFKPLTDSEMAVINRVRKMLSEVPTIPCTRCKYCVSGCPSTINIPGILGVLNEHAIYHNSMRGKGHYFWVTKESGKASDCTSCGQCEAQCPQHIDIINQMKKAAELFD